MKKQSQIIEKKEWSNLKLKPVINSKKSRGLNKIGFLNVGVVGTGLMGQSIASCLLTAGHNVISVAHTEWKVPLIRRHVQSMLKEMNREGLLKSDPSSLMERYNVVIDFNQLKDASIVVESILENLDAKLEVFKNIEAAVSKNTIICSNTSAIPISLLQSEAVRPERILGVHWAEPAHLTRFMEIICGDKTGLKYAEKIKEVAKLWGKEPSLLRKDIRGFITNRLMYALLREAFSIVESGIAGIEDVDRSMRNDLGSWITFAGPFRFMDLTGIPAYKKVMIDLFPDLSNRTDIPDLMKKVVDNGANGTANAKGFYKYTEEEAKEWEKQFLKFSYDIRKIANKYPENLIQIKKKKVSK